MGSKIYVASKFGQAEQVRRAMALLKEHGHTITYDWTYERQRVGAVTEYEIPVSTEEAEGCAERDARGVMSADYFILLTCKDGGRGVYTELGIAWSLGCTCIIVGEYLNNIFFWLKGVRRVATLQDAIKLIEDSK